MSSNANRAPELERAPDPAELLAAKAAGLTLVAYRAMQKQEPVRKSGRGKQERWPVNRIEAGEQYSPAVHHEPTDAVSIVLPWSALLPDNRRIGAAIASDGSRPFVGTTKAYRAAKAKAVEAIRTQLSAVARPNIIGPEWWPLHRSTPVAITVTLIEPNRSAKRDLLNYQKLICDAMKGIVYADDSLIDDAHFTRGAPDIDRPRAEITVRPIGG